MKRLTLIAFAITLSAAPYANQDGRQHKSPAPVATSECMHDCCAAHRAVARNASPAATYLRAKWGLVR